MRKPSFLAKLRRDVEKSIPGISYGFHDPKIFLDTGCYVLNYLSAGRFDGGVPLEGKTTMFAGDSGSGKSYIVAGNLIRDAQSKGIYVILIDTENAADRSWIEKLGVKTSEEYMQKYTVASVDDTAKFLGKVFENWSEDNKDVPPDERTRMLIVVDSVGMLITPNQERQFIEGDQKGDLGLKAKQVSNMMRVIQSKIADKPIGVVFTNHVYASQDQYSPDVIPGGKMLEFATSLIVQMNKLLLKKDETDESIVEEGSAAAGIRSSCVVRKSRYAKPFEKVQIYMPYSTGMNRYSGMFDLFEKKGCFTKSGNWYSFTSRATGEVMKNTRKGMIREPQIFDAIMAEWNLWEDTETGGFNDMSEVDDVFDEKGNLVTPTSSP